MHEITTYRDDDLTFFMLTHFDHDLADRCLCRLRRHFPMARVVVRSDGDDDPRLARFVDKFNVDFRSEQPLFPIENGGAIVERMFEIFLERPTNYLFKIDPDTVVHRRFRFVPAQRGHFGTLQGPPHRRAVQGGCLGFTLDCVRQFLGSRLLRCQALKDPHAWSTESDYGRVLAARAQRCGLASFDWILGWAATELDIPLFEFPEVRCTWKEPVDNSDRRFAITHPDIMTQDDTSLL